MNKICTSLEQSKKLIELGIDVNTADMLWTYDFTVNDINGLNIISEQFNPEENDIPAWSLTALLKFIEPYGYSLSTSLNNKIMITINSPHNLSLCFYNEPIDAAFEMICRLLENKKI